MFGGTAPASCYMKTIDGDVILTDKPNIASELAALPTEHKAVAAAREFAEALCEWEIAKGVTEAAWQRVLELSERSKQANDDAVAEARK